MTVSNDKNISLKCFYDSLFAAGNIFIEESIETPRKKLICDIEVTAIPRKIDDFPDSSIARIANETEVA